MDEKKLKLAEVLDFNGITCLPLDADRVLNGAIGKLKSVTIIGEDLEGEFFFSSSTADGPNVLWDLEMAKKKLLEIAS